jgi:hypothetical protein
MNLNASEHFTTKELIFSEAAVRHNINNTPDDPKIWDNLHEVVARCAEPARVTLGTPIRVSSGYRCSALNKLIKGAKESQHMRGEALDLIPLGRPLIDLFKELLKTPFDQLIWEFGSWIHVSHKLGGSQRGYVLRYWREPHTGTKVAAVDLNHLDRLEERA